MSAASELRVQQLSLTLGDKPVVSEVSLQLKPGEMLALIGPNGAGKTSLLKAIAQLLAYRGHVQLGGQDLQQLSLQQRARQVAYLSQGHECCWPISVADLVALGRHPYQQGWRSWRAKDKRRDDDAVLRALEKTDLLRLAERPLNQLSGGERARALLARALAVEAPLLLADEPVAALDPYHQLRVMELLRQHCNDGQNAIAVLHDLTLASRFCDRLALMDGGRLVAIGSVSDVLTPDNLRTVYGVSAMQGEYQEQCYVLPWQYHEPRERALTAVEAPPNDHPVCL